ncbi:hypothetical protein BKA67DRAFT_665597 [Truncatella angustata]|uniref:Uncharacterized protein n=1 Tax=Truncatella angustata TaxID=152316 RepID=A0A9P8RE85_9PEZI|nr:uncharacterized protein BKA67DRAFT_665597 [Truncatella angustata]KAH6638651.1 hypothetical protein BKA67DRAFT_665597 [Truncatella angustata]
MSRIKFLRGHAVTEIHSWSWMAYDGGIDYISTPFGGVDWEEMDSPWFSSMSGTDGEIHTDIDGVNVALIAEAREYSAHNGEGEIVFDSPGGSNCPPMKMHYILVVTATKRLDRKGNHIYERVGAGRLPGSYIRSERETVKIR